MIIRLSAVLAAGLICFVIGSFVLGVVNALVTTLRAVGG